MRCRQRQAAAIEQETTNLRAAILRLDGEIERLTGAIAAGGDVPSLIAGVKDRERQCDDFRRRLTAAQRATDAGETDHDGLSARLRAKLAEWTAILHRQNPQARQVLKKLLRGSLLFAPKSDGDERYYEISGEGSIQQMLASDTHPIMVASPAGVEPAF
ncbi:MAG: hypothetical protein ACM3NQ_20940 [Bacteroidales bacterium]